MAISETNAQNARRSVNIVFGEPDAGLRAALRNALTRVGFGGVRDYDKMAPLKEAVTKTELDLLVLDANMDGVMADELIQDIRYGRLGFNPFIPVILTMWEPTADLVRRIASSGTDDLLVKPISPAQLFDRIKVLTTNRKPFVVTSDYIGPDRRKDVARGSEIKSIEVPNTLRAKVRGEGNDKARMKQLIVQANIEINDMKLKRNAFQIAFLVGLILPEFARGVVTPSLADGVQRLLSVAEDTGERMRGTNYEHVSELCDSIIGVANSLSETLENPGRKDIDLLKPLSDAVLLGFNPGSNAEALTGQISSAITTYKKRTKN